MLSYCRIKKPKFKLLEILFFCHLKLQLSVVDFIVVCALEASSNISSVGRMSTANKKFQNSSCIIACFVSVRCILFLCPSIRKGTWINMLAVRFIFSLHFSAPHRKTTKLIALTFVIPPLRNGKGDNSRRLFAFGWTGTSVQ